MNLYFISGLGADKRAFQKLNLSPQFVIHHIDWIKPLSKETLSSYAKRLSTTIDQNKPFVLIGLSFGGMVATEMNRFVKPVKTILISSAAIAKELPWYIKSLRFLPLYMLMPPRLMRQTSPFLEKLFGVKTKEEKLLLNSILRDTDVSILKWSIHAITNWNNETIPANLIHIHGDADRLLPIRFVKADRTIKGGEHFMVFSKADEISEILNELLQN